MSGGKFFKHSALYTGRVENVYTSQPDRHIGRCAALSTTRVPFDRGFKVSECGEENVYKM
jgi:hypothetical protein